MTEQARWPLSAILPLSLLLAGCVTFCYPSPSSPTGYDGAEHPPSTTQRDNTMSSNNVYTPAESNLRAREWFQDAKFGMFIHWGVYSVLGRGEWVMFKEKIPLSEYEKLPAQFNPTHYDPAAWVSLVKRAGMKYITITSKHHDGFAMWDSRVSDYTIVQKTPYGKDVLKMLAEECRKQDIKLFFYHSHLDWRHPDYFPLGATGQFSGRPAQGDFNKYLDYMDAQLAELLGGDYGEVAGIWFDGWWDQQCKNMGQKDADPTKTQIDWRLEKTYRLIHRLQPQALIGDNHHVRPFDGEDFQMFEKDLPGQNTTGFGADAEIGQLPLEMCDTIGIDWGYNGTETEKDFKSVKQLIGLLANAAGNNANFLLNVGPTAQGVIQPEFIERLEKMGAWMAANGDSIYGTRGGPMPPQPWGCMTHKGATLYVHLLDAKPGETLTLPNTTGRRVRKAHLLANGVPVAIEARGDLILHAPDALPDVDDTVVAIELEP